MFHCPTASSPDHNENYAGYSRSDYVAVAGSVLSDALDASSNGVFAMNSGTRFDDIVDGTQFTLLVGERSMTLEGTHGAIWMRSINRAGNRGDGLAVTGICRRDVRLNDVTQRSGFLGRHLGGVLFAMADGQSASFQRESRAIPTNI
jgi:hypothetical protein